MTIRYALLLLAGLSAAGAGAQTADRPPPAGAETAWRRTCAARADQAGMADTMRETFLVECIAGERVTEQEARAAKPTP